MAIETPNRLAASIVFWFAEIDAEPPDLSNDFELVITAINAVKSIQTLDTDTLTQGFFLELQEPIPPEQGAWFIHGTAYEDISLAGFTPTVTETGIPSIDALINTDGNWIAFQPDLDASYGMMGVSMWQMTATENELPVELPALP
jgi:hypothetical protein